MHHRAPFYALILAVTAGLAVNGCSLNRQGLNDTVRSDGSPGGTPILVADGGTGTGGTSIVGTGGMTGGSGSGGTQGGGGGEIGSGGANSGGGGSSIGSGGAPASGGGGLVGRGGNGMGGRTGSGGAGAICNAFNCSNGCCMGATCVTNRTDQLCGRGGAACAPCDACSQCSDLGVCDPDPTARWNIICSSATLTPTRPGNLAWDTDGLGTAALADPFCQFVMGNAGNPLASTDTLTDTLVPTWNQSITPPGLNVTENFLIMQAGRWSISVIDDDAGVTTNDVACSVTPRLTAADFADGSVTFAATQSCLSLTIRLTCGE